MFEDTNKFVEYKDKKTERDERRFDTIKRETRNIIL